MDNALRQYELFFFYTIVHWLQQPPLYCERLTVGASLQKARGAIILTHNINSFKYLIICKHMIAHG